MTAIEVALPDGSARQVVMNSIYDHIVPVRIREADPIWIGWGGFIKHDRAVAQLQAKPVLIEILGWSMGSMRYGWKVAQPHEFLQGCLVRAFNPQELIVYGVRMGRRPRIVSDPTKIRKSNILQLPK